MNNVNIFFIILDIFIVDFNLIVKDQSLLLIYCWIIVDYNSIMLYLNIYIQELLVL